MKKYKFFGLSCEIGDRKLTRLGQEISLDDELARAVVAGGGAILPAEEFDKIGFTPRELENRRERNTDEFTKKLHEAITKLAALQTGGAPPQHNNAAGEKVEPATKGRS